MAFAEDLHPLDFTGSNSILWRHITALHMRGTLEVRALIEALRSAGDLATLGADINPDTRGEEYLAYIAQSRGGQVE